MQYVSSMAAWKKLNQQTSVHKNTWQAKCYLPTQIGKKKKKMEL